ncbi:TIGR03773 family transporter-associated surface protein [Streptomyces sp. NPDC046984]|uniref:TIGR03773 family transporter-associated surface protein n=1 Tax=Streptomyces sp. NPDC046984 TaxID=3155138 RepID=UPI0033DD04EA
MRTQQSARWAVLGAVGSVALAAGLSPVAFADVGDNRVGTRAAPTTDVVLGLQDGLLGLDLRQGGSNAPPLHGSSVPDIVVGADAAAVAPGGAAYSFLGEPGSPVWILDGRQAGTAVPRWDTGDVPADQLAEGTVEWALTGMEGPGDLKVFETAPDDRGTEAESSTPHVLFDSADGLPDARVLPAADSGELSWAFTEPGEYRLTSRATARLTTGETAIANAEWTVRVEGGPSQGAGPSAPASGTPEPAVPAEEEKRDRAGSARTLTAPVQAPEAESADAVVNQKVVIDDSHVDAVAGKMVNGKLRTLFKDSRNPAAPVWREPSSVVLHVDQDAKEKVPANSAYSFLGKAGADFWLIPQVQKQGVVWAGWNTEELDSGDLKGSIDMRLTNVSGPGSVAIWETTGLGNAKVLYNSADGLPDTQKVNLGVHAHGNWGFSREGLYKVTFQLSGTLANGRAASDTRTYTFAVGDVDPNTVTPGGADGGGSTGGSGSTGGTDGATGGSSGTGGTANGSLAHTGGVPAIPLAAGAGALVVAGGAALALGRGRRRIAPVEAGPRP